jgi:hypothetical protein
MATPSDNRPPGKPGDPDCKGCHGYGCCECMSPIPDGGTCESACAHIRRCKAIFGQQGHETCCQWIPSRFLARKPTPEAAP